MAAATDDAHHDEALARRIAAGADPAAEAELCRRLLPRVRAYGLRHLRDRVAAADFAQHVVTVVLEAVRAGRVADPARLGAYVAGIARNTAVEQRKVSWRRGELLARFGDALAPSAAPAPEVDRSRLAECLDELSVRLRTIVVMTYFSESEPTEIARAMATSTTSVRVQRHRALTHLRECMLRGGVAS
jgi:RNA polymerase sigma factor (sigma-70 family)